MGIDKSCLNSGSGLCAVLLMRLSLKRGPLGYARTRWSPVFRGLSLTILFCSRGLMCPPFVCQNYLTVSEAKSGFNRRYFHTQCNYDTSTQYRERVLCYCLQQATENSALHKDYHISCAFFPSSCAFSCAFPSCTKAPSSFS